KQPLEELRAKGKVAWVFGDLSDPATPAKLVDGVVSELGQLDVLVNNAGLSTAKPFFDLTAGDFDLTFAVDVRATFLLTQLAAQDMRKRDVGSVVNITSVHEHIPRPDFAVYASAKDR